MIDCSHALQEKEDQEQATKVKHLNVETAEENVASKAGDGSEEIGQEETVEEEDSF